MGRLRNLAGRALKWWPPLRHAARQGRARVRQARLEDRIDLVFPSVRVSVRRITHDPTPHELHVILPRVEIRRGCPGRRGRAGECREEIILSSITVVDAPLHPPAGERGPGNPGGLIMSPNRKPPLTRDQIVTATEAQR